VFSRCDKLWLGTNLWFSLVGALSFIQAWGPLELLAGTFKESGGFVTTAAIGVAACVTVPGSFVGAPRTGRAARYAWVLTGVAIAMAVLSYFAQGTRLLSITVPVFIFIASNFILRHLLRRAGEA
jgi:hypothetical protein